MRPYVSVAVIHRIRAMHVPGDLVTFDTMVWQGSSYGSFSSKAEYSSFRGFDHNSNSDLNRLIWKWLGLQRMKCLVWKAAGKCLLTNENRG